MANYGKRMVPEYLVKGLEEAYSKTSGGTGSTINLMENIVDSKGNKRFIEGEITNLLSDITLNYGKWSLSGSHLMMVIAGSIAANTSLTDFTTQIAEINLPDFIFDKIYPIVGTFIVGLTTNGVDQVNYSLVDVKVQLSKDIDHLTIRALSNQTFTNNTAFRVQFDLLVDAE